MGPRRAIAAALVSAVLIALYVALHSWVLLGLLAFTLLGVVADGAIWLRARRTLAIGDIAPKPAPGTHRVEARCDVPGLGVLEWRTDYESWCFDITVDDEPVVVGLEGDEAPTEIAKASWLAIRDRVPEVWFALAAYAARWGKDHGMPFEPSEAAATAIHVARAGEVEFRFEVASDLDGSWYAEVRDGVATSVGRDS